MSNSISDVLKQLDTLSIENSIQVFIPSIQRVSSFKLLNLKQQKELLKTTIDESLVKLAFNNLLTNIIAENSIDKINADNLYTFDRVAIALALRARGLEKEIVIDEKPVNIESKLADISNIQVDLQQFAQAVTDNNFTINLSAPKLGVDKEINIFALNKFKSSQENDIKTVISDLVVYEFVKFISSVVVTSGDKQNTIEFNTIKPQERVSIVEKFPSSVTNKIFAYVKQYREFESQFTNVDGVNIDVDGNFFTV